jgi:hypothetical protein
MARIPAHHRMTAEFANAAEFERVAWQVVHALGSMFLLRPNQESTSGPNNQGHPIIDEKNVTGSSQPRESSGDGK